MTPVPQGPAEPEDSSIMAALSHTPLVRPGLVLIAFAQASFAQSVLYTFNGDSPNDELGWSVSDAGDVNADGVAPSASAPLAPTLVPSREITPGDQP